MRRRPRRLAGFTQKTTDFADYLLNRGRMKLRLAGLRIKCAVRQTRIRRILIVRLGSIGDVVRATAILEPLRRRYPAARIDFLTTAATLPVIRRHPALHAVYTLEDLSRLEAYDWIINLQNRDPQESFLRDSGLTYREILEHLSTRLDCRLISGRHVSQGRETTPTNILYCVAEMEELFLTALLPYDPARYPATDIGLGDEARAAARNKFALPAGLPRLAIFLGSNSIGCGADEGFRTYSMGFIERLIERFFGRFAIVMIGQSQVRNADERRQYQEILRRHPGVIDLVDRTSLEELIALMDQFTLLISCDSSPVHIARARGVPVVGLYVSDASYRLGPRQEYEGIVGLNSRPPCFHYSWRWKFFCGVCRDPGTRAAYCRNETFVFGVDSIPLDRIDRAVSRLVGDDARR